MSMLANFTALSMLLAASASLGKAGQVKIVIVDLDRQAVSGVEISSDNGNRTRPTNADGWTMLDVGAAKVGDPVSVEIRVPKNKYIILNPYDHQIKIPPFENKPSNVAKIWVIGAQERHLLQQGRVMVLLTAQLLHKTNPFISAVKEAPALSETQALNALATSLGKPPGEIRSAIDAWASRAKDPYQKGVAALYKGRFKDASDLLEKSLQKREKELKARRGEAYDAARVLGDSYVKQRRFADAVTAYHKALEYTDDKAESYVELADAYHADNNLENEADALQRALYDDLVEGYDQLAKLYQNKGQFLKEAATLWEAEKADYNEEYPEGSADRLQTLANFLERHPVDDDLLDDVYEKLIEVQVHANERPSCDEETDEKLAALRAKHHNFDLAASVYRTGIENGCYESNDLQVQRKIRELEQHVRH